MVHIEMVVTRHILVVPALALACCKLFTAGAVKARAADATQKFERLANQLALTPESGEHPASGERSVFASGAAKPVRQDRGNPLKYAEHFSQEN